MYDFWNDDFKGVFRGSFDCGKPAEHDTLVFAVREVREHPWIVSTNRHLTQGAVDLQDVAWDASKQTLAGVSKVVAGDAYAVTVHVPDGYKAAEAEVDGHAVDVSALDKGARLKFTPGKTAVVRWSVRFNGPRSDSPQR